MDCGDRTGHDAERTEAIWSASKARPQKAPRPAFDSLDEEVAWYETHDSWDEDDVEVEFEVKQPLDKVIPVRLTDNNWGKLRIVATELGIGPTTLARMWILEKLRTIQAERAEDGERRPTKPAPRIKSRAGAKPAPRIKSRAGVKPAARKRKSA